MVPPVPPSPLRETVALQPAVVAPEATAVPAAEVLPSERPGPMPATLVLVGEPLAVNEPVRVIRMRVAGSALSSFGIRTLSAEPPETVDLDLIVGEDGVARAVRLAS